MKIRIQDSEWTLISFMLKFNLEQMQVPKLVLQEYKQMFQIKGNQHKIQGTFDIEETHQICQSNFPT